MSRNSLLGDFITSGVGVGVATACTNPIDVVKVRLQLQTAVLQGGTATPGLVSTAANLIQREGITALGSGLGPAVLRAVLYGGVRLGLYQPVKGALGGDTSFGKKLLAGSMSGAIAAAASNPMDLVKTRLQAAGRRGEKCPGSWGMARQVVQQEGVAALWKGTAAGATRAAVLTATQCATYDEVKALWVTLFGGADHLGTHFGCSMLTGLVTTTCTAPVDVIKTHMFVGGSKFSGPLQCAAHIIHTEGIRGMLKGWTANYARLGPQTTIIFLVVEQLRKWGGMGSW